MDGFFDFFGEHSFFRNADDTPYSLAIYYIK